MLHGHGQFVFCISVPGTLSNEGGMKCVMSVGLWGMMEVSEAFHSGLRGCMGLEEFRDDGEL